MNNVIPITNAKSAPRHEARRCAEDFRPELEAMTRAQLTEFAHKLRENTDLSEDTRQAMLDLTAEVALIKTLAAALSQK